MSNAGAKNRIPGATNVGIHDSTVDDCFGDTNVLNVDGPDDKGDNIRRVQVRSDMAKAYWLMTACLYAALLFLALLLG